MAKQSARRSGPKSAGARHDRPHHQAPRDSLDGIADSAEAVEESARWASVGMDVGDILRDSAKAVDRAGARLAEVGDELASTANLTEQRIQEALDFQKDAIREAARAQEQAIASAEQAMRRAVAAAYVTDAERISSVKPLPPLSRPSYED